MALNGFNFSFNQALKFLRNVLVASVFSLKGKSPTIDDRNQVIIFLKLGHFFPISKKGQGRPPPTPCLNTRLNMVSKKKEKIKVIF